MDRLDHILLPSSGLPPPPPPPVEAGGDLKSELKVATPKGSSGTKASKTSKLSKAKLVKVVQFEVELWPFILCKALLKIASMTWTEQKELVDFDIIRCLTGWTLQTINTKGTFCLWEKFCLFVKLLIEGMAPVDIWAIFEAYCDNYAWTEARPKSAKSSKSDKASSKGGKKKGPAVEEDVDDGILPCHVFASIGHSK